MNSDVEADVHAQTQESNTQRVRFRFQFRLRTLLVVITLVAFVFGFYQPVKLHLQAVHFLDQKNTVYSTDPSPDRLLWNFDGFQPGRPDEHANDILFHVEKFRIVLLGRSHVGAASGRFAVAGDAPESGAYRSIDGQQYFSYSYADGEAKCKVYDFAFVCRGREIQIDKEWYDVDKSTVVLVDTNNQILKIYSRDG